MARKGGKASPFHLNKESEEIKIDRIMDVSTVLPYICSEDEPTGGYGVKQARVGFPNQQLVHIAGQPLEAG